MKQLVCQATQMEQEIKKLIDEDEWMTNDEGERKRERGTGDWL
jgi:hypothetical protein